MTTRSWWETAVVYQLYVRSFADSNGDGIGDLEGVRSRLDYLSQLGIDAIWLNPCYPSPQFDHGYDVADYFDIEPDYGNLAQFDLLVAEARARGIKIMMDVVPNHCSWSHKWFEAAIAAGPGSRERERFWFRDGKGADGAEPPNDWPCIFGGSAWNRITEPDGTLGQWYLGLFTPQQPDLNWHDSDVNEHFDDMLRFWFDRGVEGFRVDAPTVLGKAPGLPDLGDTLATLGFGDPNPLTTWRPEGHVVWKRWRQVVNQYQRDHPERDVVLIAEAYTAKRPDIFREYVNDDEFHLSFSFDLMLAPWSARFMSEAANESLDVLGPMGLLPAWTLNNHDAQRTVTRYGRADADDESSYTGGNLQNSTAPVDVAIGTRRARAAAMLEMALPGTVYLYAGEELGLPEVLDLPAEAREDPVFIRTEGKQIGRDGCRVPLPWTTDVLSNFGFSPSGDVRPGWLPQPDSFGPLSVAVQEADPSSVLAMYRAAIAVRSTRPEFTSDAFGWVPVDSPRALAFHRGEVLVVLNTGSASLALGELATGHRVLFSSTFGHDDAAVVPPDTCVWLAR
ncbi:MAG: hypothetical protein RLZZ623_3318 [Actinomycetota bacterium]